MGPILFRAFALFFFFAVTLRAAAPPLVNQEAYFTGGGNEGFGTSVAASGDTVVVGATQARNHDGVRTGTALVYVRSGATWTLQATLEADDGTFDDLFGTQVAISGETIAVSAPYDGPVNGHTGSVYFYVRNGMTWTQQDHIVGVGDFWGNAISLSGNTLVVGASQVDFGYPGKAFVYVRNGTTWTKQADLVPVTPQSGNFFGGSVAVSGDTIVIGATGNNVKGNSSGCIYVFGRSGTTWGQQAQLFASDGQGMASFGAKVIIEGDTLIASAVSLSNYGAAYVFGRNNGIWLEQTKLIPSGPKNAAFGAALSLSGNTLAVGAFWEKSATVDSIGSAYLFTRSGGTWSEVAHFFAANPLYDDRFGSAIAVSGTALTVGSLYADAGGPNSGLAAIYGITLPAPVISVEQPAGTALADDVGSVPFGNVKVGETSAPLTFTIVNSGTADLTDLVVNKGGAFPGEYAVTGPASPTVIAGGNTTFTVTFSPGAGGARNAALHVASNVAGSSNPFDIALTGAGNFYPSALDTSTTATTGDQKTITVPATDPDGDMLTIISTTPDSHLVVNSTNGKDVTFTPAANYAGNATLGYTVSDGKGGTASGTITVTIADNDPPTIGGTFAPLVISAGIMPDYRDQADKSDNVAGVPTVTQLPAQSSPIAAGEVLVKLTATDVADNTAETSFNLTVRPAAAVNAVQLSPGDDAPGSTSGANGLPQGAKLASFGLPAIDEGGNLAFLAKWSTSPKVKGTGLFVFTPGQPNSTCLGVLGGSSPIAGAQYKTFTDPVIDQGRVACIATLTGKPKPPASVVLSNAATGGALEVIAQAGGQATVDGAKFKTFKAVEVADGYVAIFAQLAPGTGQPKVNGTNDLGLWIKDGAGSLQLALRKGQEIGNRKIQSLTTFIPGAGSPGQGRGWLQVTPGSGGRVLALVRFTDKFQAILAVNANNVGNPIIVSRSSQTGDGSPDLPDAMFASYSFPATSPLGANAMLATLLAGPGGVAKTETRGIFYKPALTGDYAAVARVGRDIVAGIKFSTLKDPVLGDDGGIAFCATIKGTSVKGLAATTLWWRRPGGTLDLLAQGGNRPGPDLPALAQWKSFTSLAIAGGGRGPVFAATLVPGKGGVTAATSSGVWATDFNHAPRQLFRAGITQVNGIPIKSFTLLKASVGSPGVTRSFNNSAQVVWLATFANKSNAIVVTEIP